MTDIVVVTEPVPLEHTAMGVLLDGAFAKLEPGILPLQPEKLVVLLPTLVSARKHAQENTSMALIRALVELVRQRGGSPAIGGNPPRALPGPRMVELFEAAGVQAVSEATGVRTLLDQRTAIVPIPTGRTAKFYAVASYVQSAGAVVAVPRLRHDDGLMHGAVRGMTSAVPGFKREEIKLAPESVERYAEQLVDLALAVQPKLVVMQVPLCAEPIDLCRLIVTDSPFAADVVAADLLGLDPACVPTVRAAHRRGLGPLTPAQVDVVWLGSPPA